MSAIFFQELGLPAPAVHLGVGSGTHGEQTARILSAFESHLLQGSERPHGVIVVGDVNSTMAAALAAVKVGVPVAHVEAGLRSFDRTMPEEINRVVTDAIADVLLVSDPSGMDNLAREGADAKRVHYVGNVMIDTLVHSLRAAQALSLPERIGVSPRHYAYVTLHRPASVDAPRTLQAMMRFLFTVTEQLPVVFPLHPRTRRRLEEVGLLADFSQRPGMHILDAQGYHDNLCLMAASQLVLTDSGGIQEETTYLGIPCLTLRPSTERPVTVSHGTNTVVDHDFARATATITRILKGDYKRGGAIPGWDGKAAERIRSILDTRWRPTEG